MRLNKNLKFINSIVILSLLIFSGCQNKYSQLDLSMYQYRDTKNLVKFVYDASLLVERDGMKSIEYFKANRDLYSNPDHYLYIYDMNGINVFHAGMPELEGKDLREITDKNGKKITKLVLEALENPNNPHAWIHYSWWEPGKFYPVPKSSSHFKVKTPEGKELYVGGGMNYPHEEKEFIRIIVDSAVQLIEKKGSEAIPEITDTLSQFNFREIRVFILDSNGELIISPVLGDNMAQINLLECTDEVGHKPFQKALTRLVKEDAVWEIFMAKSLYKRDLIKKCLYIRKTELQGKKVFVAAITDLPQPP
ncbi:MAG: cache domain-containing protein [bacterium]|nr:cache domain-containing protein [bacterium]